MQRNPRSIVDFCQTCFFFGPDIGVSDIGVSVSIYGLYGCKIKLNVRPAWPTIGHNFDQFTGEIHLVSRN